MKLRHVFTWKFLFYEWLLPALRALGPRRADATLSFLGRAYSAWPPRHARLASAAVRVGADPDAVAPELSAGSLRFLARDYLLDNCGDAQAIARFDVTGADAFTEALASGRGAVLVGSHFGAHIAAFHWLYRRGVPLRLMVQRPRHVASALNRFFDRDETDPQADFFLRRSLDPTECVSRLLRVRAALRSGKAVYLPGDVPWSGPNTRPGRLLGQPHRLLSVWTDLAALTGAPAFFVFCTHAPDGRYALTLEPAGPIAPGGEDAAVARYLARLETEIAAHPAEAVAHLLWPCYGPPRVAPARSTRRPSRRVAALPQP